MNKEINSGIDEQIESVKLWIKKTPHLPQNIDDLFIRRFLWCSELSVERAKTLIDLNFSLRNQAPEIFDNRDPKTETLRTIFQTIDYCPLPKQTPERFKLFIYRIRDDDVEKFNYATVLKAFFMVADIRMHTDLEDSRGEIPMFDMSGLSFRHLTKLSLPLMKKYMVYTQEAHPVRLRQIHVLNTAPLIDKCLAIVKPFMKSEVAQLLHFHLPNSTTLFEHVPRHLIPVEYGGTLKVTMDQLRNDWVDKVLTNREFFLDDTKWKLDEKQRTGGNQRSNLFGMQGSFRSLSID